MQTIDFKFLRQYMIANYSNKSLTLTKKRSLTLGQKHLHKLICDKLKNNDTLRYEELKKIYIEFVCRTKKDGVPHYWNYWWKNEMGDRVGRLEPVPDWGIRSSVFQWLTMSLGSLILKGYVKILPILELDECMQSNIIE